MVKSSNNQSDSYVKKHPYFHFELKRQAKNWQGGVIIDQCFNKCFKWPT